MTMHSADCLKFIPAEIRLPTSSAGMQITEPAQIKAMLGHDLRWSAGTLVKVIFSTREVFFSSIMYSLLSF